jgi:hypothetical protein
MTAQAIPTRTPLSASAAELAPSSSHPGALRTGAGHLIGGLATRTVCDRSFLPGAGPASIDSVRPTLFYSDCALGPRHRRPPI